jgi:predicted RNA-binding Zn-ribbon protein involved in translation (DUF1610 family)
MSHSHSLEYQCGRCGWVGYYPVVLDISEDPKRIELVPFCPSCQQSRVSEIK